MKVWLTEWFFIDWIINKRLIDLLTDWLIDWLIEWLNDEQIVLLIDWLIDLLIDWMIYWLIVFAGAAWAASVHDPRRGGGGELVLNCRARCYLHRGRRPGHPPDIRQERSNSTWALIRFITIFKLFPKAANVEALAYIYYTIIDIAGFQL